MLTLFKVLNALLLKPRLALRGKNKLRNFHLLKKWQWLDQGQMQALQRHRLKELLVHSYLHVPYYREALSAAAVIDSTCTIDLKNFNRIPLLDKETLLSRFEDLKSDDLHLRNWYENASGGSTGNPVKMVQDDRYLDWVLAVKMLFDLWTHHRMSEGKVVLWGSERDLFFGRETFRKRLRSWLDNELYLNAAKMTPSQMATYVTQINSFKPAQILAYVESIHELSKFIERKGLHVHSPRAIMTSAGTLYEPIRETIERVFESPVFNRYGSREAGDISCECSCHNGLHVAAPVHYVEILRPDASQARSGEAGEIVVTVLTNYAMPLIRYRIGDMGVLADESCPCGRSWPLLKEVIGRVSDNFLTKEGAQVYGAFFSVFFFFQDWIKKFQLIQEDYDFIRVLIVPRGSISSAAIMHAKETNSITEKIRVLMGPDCKVKYEYVVEIPTTASGKYRYTVSKVV